MLPHLELILRISVGALFGAIIGYERARHGRPLGLRTHMLVALASATFMVVSTQFVYYQRYEPDGLVEVDSSRIAASVVSAVGFLAGGSILRSGVSVHGLTTAAGMWLVTAIGLCSGAGMYIEASYATGLGLLALAFLRRFEDKDDLTVRRSLFVVTSDRADLTPLIESLREAGAVVTKLQYDNPPGEEPRIAVTFDLRHEIKLGPEALLLDLEQRPGVRTVRIEPGS